MILTSPVRMQWTSKSKETLQMMKLWWRSLVMKLRKSTLVVKMRMRIH